MAAISSQAPPDGWHRVSRRPRRTRGLVEKVLATVREWRRRGRDRIQFAAGALISRDSKSCGGAPFDFDREQTKHLIWLATLDLPPF